MTKRKKGGRNILLWVIGGGVVVIGGLYLMSGARGFSDFFYWLDTKLPPPLGSAGAKVPAGGGVQMTAAGPRYLAGPDDLPSLV